MAEESVRVESSHVAARFAQVNELDEEMKEWEKLNPEYLKRLIYVSYHICNLSYIQIDIMKTSSIVAYIKNI
jgi:hypothetical protein